MEQMSLSEVNKEIIKLKEEMVRIKSIVEDDLEFAKRTEEAWQEIDDGKFKEYSVDEFFESLKEDN